MSRLHRYLPLSPNRPADRGFTLVEILISMLFFSLGIMGIIAFFFLGVRDAREAERRTTATMMARDVREALSNALRYPVVDDRNGSNTTRMYRFELPYAGEHDPSVTAAYNPELQYAQGATNQRRDLINGFYFMIGSTPGEVGGNTEMVLEPFPYSDTSGGTQLDQYVLDLPYEGFTDPDDPSQSTLQQVHWFGDRFKAYEPDDATATFDGDVSHFYSFRILIRRGLSASGESEGPLKAGDLLNCTVYIFRSYNLGDAEQGVANPYAGGQPQFDSYYNPRTGDALFNDPDYPDAELLGVQPVATHHFTLSGS